MCCGCAQGIGRTGTFCAVDILLQRLDAWPQCQDGCGPDRDEVEAALNVPHLVHELRRQRMGMVQTLEQYAFVYKAVVEDLQVRLAGRPGWLAGWVGEAHGVMVESRPDLTSTDGLVAVRPLCLLNARLLLPICLHHPSRVLASCCVKFRKCLG